MWVRERGREREGKKERDFGWQLSQAQSLSPLYKNKLLIEGLALVWRAHMIVEGGCCAVELRGREKEATSTHMTHSLSLPLVCNSLCLFFSLSPFSLSLCHWGQSELWAASPKIQKLKRNVLQCISTTSHRGITRKNYCSRWKWDKNTDVYFWKIKVTVKICEINVDSSSLLSIHMCWCCRLIRQSS